MTARFTMPLLAVLAAAALAAGGFFALSTAYAEDPDLSPFYDANDNGVIDRDEVITSVSDYFAGVITRDQALTIIQYYFTEEPVPDVEVILERGPEDRTLSEVIEDVRPSVVYVRNAGTRTRGSGVIFKAEGETGYVMTNSHVVDDNEGEGWAVRTDDGEWYRATLLRADPLRDLAVLTICCDDFPALDFADWDSVDVGDDVFVMGYPGPLLVDTATVTKGVVSAIRYDLGQDSIELQHDAATNPGNSGGPILTDSGLIAGVHKSRLVDYQGSARRGLSFGAFVTTIQIHMDALMTPGGEFVFEDVDATLYHNPDSNTIKTQRFTLNSSTGRADVEFEATFTNPYASSIQLWSYGLGARYDPYQYDDNDLPSLRFVIDSRQIWTVTTQIQGVDGTEHVRLGSASVSNIKTGADAQNHLKVRLEGDVARFWVNGQQVGGAIDISSVPHAGNIGVFTGYFSGSEREGAVTESEGLRGKLLDQ